MHRNFLDYTLQFSMQIFRWHCIIFKHFYDEYNGDKYLVYVPHTLVGNGTLFTWDIDIQTIQCDYLSVQAFYWARFMVLFNLLFCYFIVFIVFTLSLDDNVDIFFLMGAISLWQIIYDFLLYVQSSQMLT